MPNMSYCRFENTYRALLDCSYNINKGLSESEHKYRERLVQLCEDILNEFDPESIDEEEEDEEWDS